MTRPALSISRCKQVIYAAVTVLFATALSLVAAEWVLDEYVDHQRRSAKAHPDYDAVRSEELGPGGLMRPGFSAQLRDGYGGTVPWTINAQGFRHEHEFAPTPPPGVLRILSLGDSFTAGYRVGQLDTFSRRLEEWSNTTFAPTEVLISLIEHPPLGVRWLDAYGSEWSPDIVLLGVTIANDIASSYIALHPEPITFADLEPLGLPDGARSVQPTPIADWIAKRRLVQLVFGQRESIGTSFNGSTSPKLFDGVNALGMFLRDPPPQIEEAYQRLFRVLGRFEAWCSAHGVSCAILVFPQRFQVQPEDWSLAVHHYGLRAEAFDLRRPNRRIAEFCAGRTLRCIDATAFLEGWHRRTGEDLYLPRGDMHWTAGGHRVWLEGAKPALSEMIQAALRRKAGSDR